MYFSWQHLPRTNAVQTVLSGGTQRFYFDTRGGVILPGERMQFEFMFKAEKAGVFTERWSLQTGPVLCGGQPVLVSLTGIAYTEDLHAQRRSEITVCQVDQAACANTPHWGEGLAGCLYPVV